MTLTLVLIAAFGFGFGFRSWWLLLAPLLCGCAAAAAILLTGHSLTDTPIPFLVSASTIAMAAGILFQRFRTAALPGSH